MDQAAQAVGAMGQGMEANVSGPRPKRFDPRTYAIIGAAQEVHRVLGCGFLERVYQLALAAELRRRGIAFDTEVSFGISYKGERLECAYRADLICYGDVVVETKALAGLGGIEEGQVINYLKVTGHRVGLLLNFGAASLQARRFALGWEEDGPGSVKSA